MEWAVKPPSEVCESAGKYSEWTFTQYKKQARYGFGMDDVLEAERGYNLTAPVHFAVWRACRKRFDDYKTKHFMVTDLIEIILNKEFIDCPFDRTTICHTIGALRALGLVYRLTDGVKEYEYVFEDTIIEKGMDWFLKDNSFILNSPPLGGLLDECLVK